MVFKLSNTCFRLFWKEDKSRTERKGLAVRAARMMETRARSADERELQKKHGILLDGKTHFRFSLMRNYGIGWGRSLQILKHLEMHEYAKSPEITSAFKEKVLQITNMVKAQKYTKLPTRVIS